MTDLDSFLEQAEAWLAEHGPEPKPPEQELEWGVGELDVSVFHNATFDEERAVIDRAVGWHQKKAECGYHAISWPEEYGGLGLSRAHARGFGRLERALALPTSHELFTVSVGLIAPAVQLFGTDEQMERYLEALVRADLLCCQLFSEPGAGSDLAALGCRAVRDGDTWVINGQKVWSSGAPHADLGLLIARSDPDVVKHKGLTAFLVPFDAPGVEVRPIRQMSGGASFGEVFLTDVELGEGQRLGAVGDGWKVALTVLSFERDHSSGGGAAAASGGSWRQLRATAEAMGVTEDPMARQDLMRVFTHKRVESMLNRRAADLARAGTPGPEASLGKIFWTEGMTLMSEVVSRVLGPHLVADTGEWGTYTWGDHVLGAPGYRIAGGSDEIQRNIIGERVLGLAGEPRVDKDLSWKDIPR